MACHRLRVLAMVGHCLALLYIVQEGGWNCGNWAFITSLILSCHYHVRADFTGAMGSGTRSCIHIHWVLGFGIHLLAGHAIMESGTNYLWTCFFRKDWQIQGLVKGWTFDWWLTMLEDRLWELTITKVKFFGSLLNVVTLRDISMLHRFWSTCELLCRGNNRLNLFLVFCLHACIVTCCNFWISLCTVHFWRAQLTSLVIIFITRLFQSARKNDLLAHLI